MCPDASDQRRSTAIEQLEAFGLSTYAVKTFVALVVSVAIVLSILQLRIPFATVLWTLVPLVALPLVFLPMDYVLPPVDVSLREVLPGAVVVAAGWVLLQVGFRCTRPMRAATRRTVF